MKEYQLFILELYFPPINHHRKRGVGGICKSWEVGKGGIPRSAGREFNPVPFGALQEHREPRAGAAAPGTAPGSHPSS